MYVREYISVRCRNRCQHHRTTNKLSFFLETFEIQSCTRFPAFESILNIAISRKASCVYALYDGVNVRVALITYSTSIANVGTTASGNGKARVSFSESSSVELGKVESLHSRTWPVTLILVRDTDR